jgi:hypothetical protein
MTFLRAARPRGLIFVLTALACAAVAFDGEAKSKKAAKCEPIAEPPSGPTEVIKKSKQGFNVHGGRSPRRKAENCAKNAPEPAAPPK